MLAISQARRLILATILGQSLLSEKTNGVSNFLTTNSGTLRIEN